MKSRTALVTGANQGLGRALVAGLAARLRPADRVLLTGRDPERVRAAATALPTTGARVEGRVLDVRDPDAITALAAELGEVDIVFSNATSRMRPDADLAAEVDAVAETNNVATSDVLRAFAPRMRPGGRLIIVASALGTLDKLDERVRARFAAAATSLDAVDALVAEWRAAVSAFADAIAERHGGVDIVFSNAAARLTPATPWAELAGPFVDTNNLGATRMLRAFDPILRPGGRLLVVASDFGSLRRLPTHLHARFDTDTMTLHDVDAAMLAWRDAVVEGRAGEEGWPEWINIPSKVGQVAAVRAIASERRDEDRARGVLVAALCPGLIDTAASRPWFADMSSAQTPDEAAAWPVELAVGEAFDPAFYGELVQFGRVLPWETGIPVPHRATA